MVKMGEVGGHPVIEQAQRPGSLRPGESPVLIPTHRDWKEVGLCKNSER